MVMAAGILSVALRLAGIAAAISAAVVTWMTGSAVGRLWVPSTGPAG
jgi:hypothetical protein